MNQRISELNLLSAPDGTEYFEVIIPPYTPGTNRRVLSQTILGLVNHYRGDWAGTTALPATGGTFTAGVPGAGDEWRLTNQLVIGGNVYVAGTMIKAAINTPGQTLANWIFLAVQL